MLFRQQIYNTRISKSNPKCNNDTDANPYPKLQSNFEKIVDAWFFF